MQAQQIRGKTLSKMTLGTVQLGLHYGIANSEGKPSREKSFKILRSALEAGVTSLDTASGYGDSELVLGDFFASQWKGELPVLTTKCKLNAPNDAPAAQVEKEIIESVEASLTRLHVKSVDYLLLHQASDMARFSSNVVSETLQGLVKKGMVKTLGVSVYYAEEIERMLHYDCYRAVQLPMGVLDQRIVHSGVLKRLKSSGVDVFVRSVFLQGICFLEPEKMDEELFACAAKPVKTLRSLAERANMSVAQFAVSFIRDLPGVTSLVLGADNPAQVAEDAALLDGPAIPQALLDEAMRDLREVDYEAILAVLRRTKPQ
ncbi:aldo/keto reductase [Christensenellaceae bacterium OttesenSCG-928-M15]|nr:aldo/keto reductase [Christensenellaceae bacterium OttesenSCG-928-M15]